MHALPSKLFSLCEFESLLDSTFSYQIDSSYSNDNGIIMVLILNSVMKMNSFHQSIAAWHGR